MSTRLTGDQLSVMAAILGVSNSGSDHLFCGPHPEFLPEMVKQYVTSAQTRRRAISVDDATHWFVASLCENEEMLENFQDEARSWVKKLRRMPITEVKRIWTRYAPFVDALTV